MLAYGALKSTCSNRCSQSRHPKYDFRGVDTYDELYRNVCILAGIKKDVEAWKVRWTKKTKRGYIESLLAERGLLTAELIAFSEDLDLPVNWVQTTITLGRDMMWLWIGLANAWNIAGPGEDMCWT